MWGRKSRPHGLISNKRVKSGGNISRSFPPGERVIVSLCIRLPAKVRLQMWQSRRARNDLNVPGQIPSLRKLYPNPTIEIHPDTARKRKIADGDWVMVENVRGKIRMRAKLTSKIHPRMVDVQHGWWFPEEIPEDPVLFGVFQSNPNVLTTDEDDYCDGPTGSMNFTPLLCRVYPVKKYQCGEE